MYSKRLKKIKSIAKRVGYDLYRAFLIIVSHFILIYAGIYIGMSKCEARTIYYGSETETVTVSYGAETIFRFNESVKTISRASRFTIAPSDSNNPDYAVLSVTPRFTRGVGKVTFLLANGAVVTTKIVTVLKELPEKVENFYDFLPKKSLIEKEANAGPAISDLELMKAMIRWEEIVGIKERSLIRTVMTGNADLSAKLVRVYTGAKFNGYVFKIRNLSKKKEYAVGIRSLSLGRPNQALLSQVDKKLLKPNEATFLRIVAKPTSIYYNVNLPVGAVQSE
ncbi:MAG: hypothetical protein COW00_02315 [Bdellovibrio sp. CG12_big_fil_rev_8_21_14_0_65_39_13]|nr:MAG: hypothetical protein COW78_09660 [Bdellovibrio sp. CG22_combo_CG10-13_8_21_14_all_39_27]PIQ62081.1 MAG: hypothetical protein COW00_02315 [Bdellovibrio sp. CG12_big_fil_rev_8_21_14_0_65_39_13]PIR32389.1 MAG: hypothetical protein COV37_20000 [Bdellovibrio sp. CG11_big_fil_rev_8_21_14_0_20_39_38]